jgi:hypothetical protein
MTLETGQLFAMEAGLAVPSILSPSFLGPSQAKAAPPKGSVPAPVPVTVQVPIPLPEISGPDLNDTPDHPT